MICNRDVAEECCVCPCISSDWETRIIPQLLIIKLCQLLSTFMCQPSDLQKKYENEYQRKKNEWITKRRLGGFLIPIDEQKKWKCGSSTTERGRFLCPIKNNKCKCRRRSASFLGSHDGESSTKYCGIPPTDHYRECREEKVNKIMNE